jgi:hypothetical protein
VENGGTKEVRSLGTRELERHPRFAGFSLPPFLEGGPEEGFEPVTIRRRAQMAAIVDNRIW